MRRSTPLELQAVGVSRTFSGRTSFGRRESAPVHALVDISFTLAPGSVLAVVGESGSGKTTLARILAGLLAPSAGVVRLGGQELAPTPSRSERRARARLIQIVFQDPYTSLDPRWSTSRALDEIQRVHFRDRDRHARARRTAELLEAVGLQPEDGAVLPRHLSGGQRQRAALAKALAPEPRYVVLDEVVSALDVSTQAQIVNLLRDLQAELDIGYVLISHDLAVARQLADQVLVMCRGEAVEMRPADALFDAPSDPYTQALIDSVPTARVGQTERPEVLFNG